METFSALLAICAGNSPVLGEFPAQRPVMLIFDVFFDLRLNNGWLNNREAGDLRRYRAHHDVIVMECNGHIPHRLIISIFADFFADLLEMMHDSFSSYIVMKLWMQNTIGPSDGWFYTQAQSNPSQEICMSIASNFWKRLIQKIYPHAIYLRVVPTCKHYRCTGFP